MSPVATTAARNADARPLRLALIGAGFFAQNHLHAWHEIAAEQAGGLVELVAVCDIDRARAEAAAAQFGARAYTDAQTLLANEQLDFVDIASTPPSHRALVELAARHGLPAICQKPMAWTLEDGQAMVDACARAGVPLMIHENFRFQYPMREVKRILDSGAIGTPFFARVSFRTAHDVYAAQPWLVDNERMIIIDVAVHLIDLARFFLGEPQTLYARTQRVNPRIRGEDVASILLGFDHASCLVDVSYETCSDHNTYPQTFVTIEGSAGTITLGADYRLQVVSRGEVSTRTLVIPDHGWSSPPWNAIQDSVVTLQRHWLDCLRHARPPETSGASTLRLLELTLASYASAESGQAIAFGTADDKKRAAVSSRTPTTEPITTGVEFA